MKEYTLLRDGNDAIVLNGNIKIIALTPRLSKEVHIGIDAPREVPIVRDNAKNKTKPKNSN